MGAWESRARHCLMIIEQIGEASYPVSLSGRRGFFEFCFGHDYDSGVG